MTRFAALLLPPAFFLAGCQSAKPARPSVPQPALPRAEAGAAAPEVRDFGYIGKLSRKGRSWLLTVEYAELFRGDAARQAARDDGAIGKGEDLEDDYYVREGDHETGTFTVDPAAGVTLAESSEAPVGPVPLKDFLNRIHAESAAKEESELASAPYWFTLKGDRIIRIEQQYVP